MSWIDNKWEDYETTERGEFAGPSGGTASAVASRLKDSEDRWQATKQQASLVSLAWKHAANYFISNGRKDWDPTSDSIMRFIADHAKEILLQEAPQIFNDYKGPITDGEVSCSSDYIGEQCERADDMHAKTVEQLIMINRIHKNYDPAVNDMGSGFMGSGSRAKKKTSKSKERSNIVLGVGATALVCGLLGCVCYFVK